MAQYSTLTRNEIETILANYSIQNIEDFEVLAGGSVNTNYLVHTDQGKYVLTICETRSENEARELAHLLEYLEQHKFETSKVIRTTKYDPISQWNNRPIIVKKFIEEKILKDLPSHLMEILGRELGKLHKIGAPEYLPTQLSFGKEQFVDVEIYAPHSSFDIWLKKKMEYVLPYISSNLPKAFIHADVFYDNVVVSEDKRSVTIMDFEEAAYYYRVFDLGMMIIGTCGDRETINFEKASYMLKGYLQEIGLLEIELNALQAFTVYAATAMTFWRHINFNYTKPDPSMSNHYLGLKVIADYVEEQDADVFLELLKLQGN